jgi:hypothetical protein
MDKTNQIKDDGDGAIHICDNIYRVKYHDIILEKTKVESDEEGLRFFNPRNVELSKSSDCPAFSRAEMDVLKRAIQTQGLTNPLIARLKEGKIRLVEGHRRYQVIGELLKENAPCFDPSSGKAIPANELYSSVICRIYGEDTTDEECFALAFNEDKTKVHFGAGAEIRFVYHCMMREVTDSNIIKMLGSTTEWLRDTKILIRQFEDDEIILQAIFMDKINRSAAKALAQVEDFRERREIFNHALEEATEDCDAKLDKYRKSIAAIDNRIEIAKGRKIVSIHTEDQESADKYDDEIEKLTTSKTELEEKVDETSVVINPENLRKGTVKTVTAGKARPKTGTHRVAPPERISTKWRKFFDNLNDSGRIGETEISSTLVNFCVDLLNQCTDKDNDPESFMLRWDADFKGE